MALREAGHREEWRGGLGYAELLPNAEAHIGQIVISLLNKQNNRRTELSPVSLIPWGLLRGLLCWNDIYSLT